MSDDRTHARATAQDPTPGHSGQRPPYLAGLWAAELLGLFGRAATDYARSVVRHPGPPYRPGHDDDQDPVTPGLDLDLDARAERGELREKMAHFLAQARRQIGKAPPRRH